MECLGSIHSLKHSLKPQNPAPLNFWVQLPQLEVWFQRASDVVRKLVRGDLDLGIVGADMFAEIAAGSPDLIVLHDGLDFGHCHLGLGVPTTGRFADINTLQVTPSCQAQGSGQP
jgi:ATP phosphoribosyltransferase